MSLKDHVINELNRTNVFKERNYIKNREVRALIEVLERFFGDRFKGTGRHDFNNNSSKK